MAAPAAREGPTSAAARGAHRPLPQTRRPAPRRSGRSWGGISQPRRQARRWQRHTAAPWLAGQRCDGRQRHAAQAVEHGGLGRGGGAVHHRQRASCRAHIQSLPGRACRSVTHGNAGDKRTGAPCRATLRPSRARAVPSPTAAASPRRLRTWSGPARLLGARSGGSRAHPAHPLSFATGAMRRPRPPWPAARPPVRRRTA